MHLNRWLRRDQVRGTHRSDSPFCVLANSQALACIDIWFIVDAEMELTAVPLVFHRAIRLILRTDVRPEILAGNLAGHPGRKCKPEIPPQIRPEIPARHPAGNPARKAGGNLTGTPSEWHRQSIKAFKTIKQV